MQQKQKAIYQLSKLQIVEERRRDTYLYFLRKRVKWLINIKKTQHIFLCNILYTDILYLLLSKYMYKHCKIKHFLYVLGPDCKEAYKRWTGEEEQNC